MTQLSTSRYQHRSLLGQGGMGRVSLVYDTLTEREVALKEILLEGANVAEFKQEFWWMSRLRHAHLVEVYDFGTTEVGSPYFTMEVVGGQALSEALPLPEDQVRSVLTQLLKALGYIHRQGLVHGDIKPENIRLLPDGTIKLMDFGLMTRAGQVAAVSGTPAFMAPEVIRRGRVDQRADLYAVGVLAYQLLTGALPFTAASAAALLRAHLEDTPPPPARLNKAIDASWNRLVMKLLSKEPPRRPQAASEVLEALGEHVEDEGGTLLVSPFVGREAELEQFGSALAELARRKTPAPLTISAPSGAGKSRLLDELALRGQLAERCVLRGAGQPGGAPYEPWIQVLRGGWAELTRLDPQLVTTHGPALKGLMADVVKGPEAPRLEPAQEKLRLQGAVADVLLALARHQGLVVLLDGWQDADALSRELHAVLTRRFAEAPVLLVTATTEREEGAIALAPLDRAALGQMVGAMLGVEAVPDAFLAQVAELTAGQPYAVEAFLDHLVGHRLLARERGQWVLAPLAPAALPRGIQEILADRLAGLSELSARVLRLAAVIRRPFDLAFLLRLLPDVAPEALYETLAGLEQAQLLSHAGSEYQAAQAHLAEALLHELPAGALSALHTQVAEALEEAHEGEENGVLVVRLAEHFLAGDRPVKAVHYAAAAAHRLADLYANDQVVDLTTRGLALLDRHPEAPAGFRLDFLSLSGDMHRRASAFAEAEAAYAAALPIAEAQHRPEAVAHVLVSHGLVKQMQSDYDAALDLFRRALPTCRELPSARQELRCLAAMGRVHYYAGDKARSVATYEEGLARARSVGDRTYEGECLGFLGLLAVSTEPGPGAASQVGLGLDYLRQSIEIKQAVGDKRGLNDSYMLRGNALMALGDLPGAERDFLANQALCREIGALEDEIFSYLNLGLVAGERGDHLLALERIREANGRAEARQSPMPLGFGHCLEARSLLALGQLGQPLALLEGSLAKARELDNRYWELFALVYLIEAQLHLGRLDDAQHSLLEALSAQAETGITEYALAIALAKATLAMRQGNLEPAESAFRDALVRAEGRQAQLVEAKASFGLAELSYLSGAIEDAERWADRGHACALATDAQALAAEVLHLQGRLASAFDPIEADRRLLRVQEAAERLHLVDLLARALHQRAVLQYPSPQAGKLLKRAQDLMIQEVDSLTDGWREPFLMAESRYLIYQGELPGASVPAPEDGETGADARAALAQQRAWIDELQGSLNLLMKQLDFAQHMARSTDAHFVMTHALALILEVTQGDRAELLLLEGKRLQPRAKKQLTGLKRIDEDWTLYAEAIDEVLETGEIVYVPTTDDRPEWGLDEPRTVMVAPLIEESARTGVVLVLGHPEQAGQLMKREVDAVRLLGNQLAATLRNIRLQNEWREKTQRLEMLYMLSSSVTSTLVMEEVLDLVVKLSLEITKADRGFLLLSNDQGELECLAARFTDGPIANLGAAEHFSRSICQRVLDTGEAVCIEDTLDDDVLKHQKSIQDLNLRTVMCVPLKVKQRYLGVLYVDSRVVVNTFTQRDLDLLKSIASQASIAIENARLYTLATVDGLTGLYFRSHFEQRMREELQRAQRFGGSLAYLMMDIDHFKKFNDTYGHAVGDEVLRHVAGVIKESMRTDIDIPCRYGGEEMVALLPETDEAGAMILAERIRKAVDETILDTEEHKGLHVTLSIGVAVYPGHSTAMLELMEYADQALYHSKRAGRNQVTMFSPDLSAGE